MTAFNKETIIVAAQEFCAKVGIQEAKGYSQEAHCAFLTSVIGKLIPDLLPSQKLDILTTMQLHGLGGNHSQFKQRLYPKPGVATEVATSDLLSRYQL